MADDPKLVNYRKNVQRYLDDYDKEITAAGKEITAAVKELEKLGVKDPLKEFKSLLKDKDKNKQKLAACIEKAKQRATNAAASLQLNLKLLEDVPPAPQDELDQFLKWLKKTIEERSVKLAKNTKVKLQLGFNKKYTKLESGGLELIVNF